MRIRLIVVTLMLLALAVVWGAREGEVSDVEVVRLSAQTWEEFAPGGKEVDAIYGDYVIRNAYLTAVIADPVASRHANMTVRDVGGALIDLTARDHESDQLSAFYPGRRRFAFRRLQVRDHRQQVVDMSEARVVQSDTASVTVSAAAASGKPAVEVTYQLNRDDRWLTVRSKFTNPSNEPLEFILEDDIRADAGKEWMDKAQNGGGALYWIHDRYWRQAYGVAVIEGGIQFNSDARNSVLRYSTGEGPTVRLEPGGTLEFERRVFPGTSLIDVRAIAAEMHGNAAYPVKLVLQDGMGRPLRRAEIAVRSGTSQIGSATTDETGTLRCRLPAGEFQFRAKHLGHPVGSSLKIDVQPREQEQQFDFRLEPYRPGIVHGLVTDSTGKPVPCKIDFLADQATPQPDFGPESAEFAVKNLLYAHQGRFEQPLAAGTYSVLISHGPEFDLEQRTVVIPPGESVELNCQLKRSVHTPGWISSDFHSHSSPSGDNTGSQLGRVLNLVCEQVEFAPCTEHNRIDTYVPHIKRLGVESLIGTVSGMELTGQPLLLNHQNVFPLKHRPHTQDGGGPVTDVSPERQVERIASWDNHSEKLIQQNHPDIGWLFFDANGDGQADRGHERSFALLDVMEIHPIHMATDVKPTYAGSRFTGNHRIFNWLQLLNQGYRIYGVVNTDAHYNYHGSSSLRNWIHSPTDDPAEIDPLDVVHAAESGHLIMSNGPYLEVSVNAPDQDQPAIAGDELHVPGGEVELRVRVQCANWIDIDRVSVLVNGRVSPSLLRTRAQHPDQFGEGVVKFDQQFRIRVDQDAHLVVIVTDSRMRLGRVVGDFWGEAAPAAISNPIFIDLKGDGFDANRDTLGAPLPVKYSAAAR